MKKIVHLLPLLFLLCHASIAQVSLPQLIRDSMVLQRDAKIKIWGWASPKEKVKVNFNKKDYSTVTGTDGKWALALKSMEIKLSLPSAMSAAA